MLSPEAKKLSQEMSRIRIETEKAKDDVIAFVRNLPMTLKDRGCASTAAELESRLFILDAQSERMKVLAQPENMEHVIEILEHSMRER